MTIITKVCSREASDVWSTASVENAARGILFPVYLKCAPQTAFVSRPEIKLARKEYTVFEQLEGAPRPPPRAVFLFKAREEYMFIKFEQVAAPPAAPPPPAALPPPAGLVFKGSKGLALCERSLPERPQGEVVFVVFRRGDGDQTTACTCI